MARPRKKLSGAELRAWNLAHYPPVIHKRHRTDQAKKSKKYLPENAPNHWIERRLGGHDWNLERYDESVQVLKEFTHSSWHLRGYLDGRRAFFRVDRDGDNYLPCRSVLKGTSLGEFMRCEFHSQPTRSAYSDIPAREDVYRFIKHATEVFISIGKTRIGIFQKDMNTELTRQRLEEWEASHSQLISRLRKRHPDDSAQETFRRYSYAALRGVGLKWPDKPFKKRQNWPELFEDLGILLKVIDYT
jgi:hypothetical protein